MFGSREGWIIGHLCDPSSCVEGYLSFVTPRSEFVSVRVEDFVPPLVVDDQTAPPLLSWVRVVATGEVVFHAEPE